MRNTEGDERVWALTVSAKMHISGTYIPVNWTVHFFPSEFYILSVISGIRLFVGCMSLWVFVWLFLKWNKILIQKQTVYWKNYKIEFLINIFLPITLFWLHLVCPYCNKHLYLYMSSMLSRQCMYRYDISN